MAVFYRYGAREYLGALVENDGCVVTYRTADGAVECLPVGCVRIAAA